MMVTLLKHRDYEIRLQKGGGYRIYWQGEKCKDPMNQTGLGKHFASWGDAHRALDACNFDPLTDPR